VCVCARALERESTTLPPLHKTARASPALAAYNRRFPDLWCVCVCVYVCVCVCVCVCLCVCVHTYAFIYKTRFLAQKARDSSSAAQRARSLSRIYIQYRLPGVKARDSSSAHVQRACARARSLSHVFIYKTGFLAYKARDSSSAHVQRIKFEPIVHLLISLTKQKLSYA